MFDAEPELLNATATRAAGCLGQLEGNLKTLSSVQDELHAAVVSKGAGNAIYNTLGNAYQSGVKLGGSLQGISEALSESGAVIQATDDEVQASIIAAGADGVLDVGEVGGSWGSAATPESAKVDTNTW